MSTDQEKYLEALAEIEYERDKDILRYYGMRESENSLEAQMRDNGVSWSDFI